MQKPFLGFGLGLRTDHFQDVLDRAPTVDWFEVISENFMVAGGKPKFYLHAIRERYPLVMHGVSMSIGSADPLNMDYLSNLKALINEVQPEWVSDHLCWTGMQKMNSHDLLPLPYTDDVIQHLIERIKFVQDYLGRQILIENVSSYLTFSESHLTEWDFLNIIAEEADCNILLDINNIYVSARNHGFKAEQYIDAMNPNRIWQIHLAGHSDYGQYVIDTHDHDISEAVWELYQYTAKKIGPVSTMIERDDHIPPLGELVTELDKARLLTAPLWHPQPHLVCV